MSSKQCSHTPLSDLVAAATVTATGTGAGGTPAASTVKNTNGKRPLKSLKTVTTAYASKGVAPGTGASAGLK